MFVYMFLYVNSDWDFLKIFLPITHLVTASLRITINCFTWPFVWRCHKDFRWIWNFAFVRPCIINSCLLRLLLIRNYCSGIPGFILPTPTYIYHMYIHLFILYVRYIKRTTYFEFYGRVSEKKENNTKKRKLVYLELALFLCADY